MNIATYHSAVATAERSDQRRENRALATRIIASKSHTTSADWAPVMAVLRSCHNSRARRQSAKSYTGLNNPYIGSCGFGLLDLTAQTNCPCVVIRNGSEGVA